MHDVVAVITYGHSPDLVLEAIRPALELRESGRNVECVIYDDASGQAPRIPGCKTLVSPRQAGYAAALNALAETHSKARRLVLINPDAVVTSATLQALLAPTEHALLVAPEAKGDQFGNVRSILEPGQVLRQLIHSRLGQPAHAPVVQGQTPLVLGDPWVPSGAVASFDVAQLNTCPVRPEMFWLEMSAWARDTRYKLTFAVVGSAFEHAGDSSRAHASRAVQASYFSARCAYVRAYGNKAMRLLLPLAVVLHLAIQTATGRYRGTFARALWAIYRGRQAWQSAAARS